MAGVWETLFGSPLLQPVQGDPVNPAYSRMPSSNGADHRCPTGQGQVLGLAAARSESAVARYGGLSDLSIQWEGCLSVAASSWL